MGSAQPPSHIRFRSGSLWPAILRQTQQALENGSLRPIRTRQEFVEDAGVRFLVRVVSSLAVKDRSRAQQRAGTRASPALSPFLPPESDLLVAEISDTHRAVLNKFNVIDHHLLIVTREFEDQDVLLTRADFEALWACMMEYSAMGFYNGGVAAGASQPHKHLQMIPLPLTADGPAIPVEPLLRNARTGDGPGIVPGLPFRHAFIGLGPDLPSAPGPASHTLLGHYHALLERSGPDTRNGPGPPRHASPYNLLVTRDWMLLVPRSRECFAGVSVNALGFAGSLFVRNADQMQRIQAEGPMRVLQHVAFG